MVVCVHTVSNIKNHSMFCLEPFFHGKGFLVLLSVSLFSRILRPKRKPSVFSSHSPERRKRRKSTELLERSGLRFRHFLWGKGEQFQQKGAVPVPASVPRRFRQFWFGLWLGQHGCRMKLPANNNKIDAKNG